MLNSLKEKKKTFQDISTAAAKQANKIQENMKELEESEQLKKDSDPGTSGSMLRSSPLA